MMLNPNDRWPFLTEDEISEARVSAPSCFKMRDRKDSKGRNASCIYFDQETWVLQQEAFERSIAMAAANPKRKYRAEFAVFENWCDAQPE